MQSPWPLIIQAEKPENQAATRPFQTSDLLFSPNPLSWG